MDRDGGPKESSIATPFSFDVRGILNSDNDVILSLLLSIVSLLQANLMICDFLKLFSLSKNPCELLLS